MLTLDDHTPPSWGTRQCQGARRRVQVMPSSGGTRPASGRQAGKPSPVSDRRATHRTPAGDQSLHYRRRAGPPQTRAILSRTNIDLQHRRAEGEPRGPSLPRVVRLAIGTQWHSEALRPSRAITLSAFRELIVTQTAAVISRDAALTMSCH